MTGDRHSRTLDREHGRFRSVITDLEMRSPPSAPVPAPPHPGVTVERWMHPRRGDYLALFRRIGDPWLWFARLEQPPAELDALLADEAHETWRLLEDGVVAGLCELDRSTPGEVEIAYFGLVPNAIGRGLAGYFLRSMLDRAWTHGIDRVWLHTCTEDHPSALEFYRHVGFRVCGERVEWVHDPRLRGLLPRHAAPHVPIPE